jgi:hypothetical protein
MSSEALAKLVQEQIRVEKNFVLDIDKQIEGIHNVAAKLLLMETKMDSQKHAMILEGILKVITSKNARPLWDTLQDTYVDKLVVKKNLENHMKTEIAMLDLIEKEMKGTEDEGIRLLLEHIANDEKKHHQILETVVRQAYKIKP